MRKAFAVLLLGLPACLLLTDPVEPWPCRTDADCHGDQRCRGPTGGAICIGPDDCATDLDCRDHPAGSWCAEGLCRVPSCRDDRPCAPYRCVEKRACGISCAQPTDCAAGRTCVDRACVPIPCTDAKPCGGGRCVGGFCATDCEASGCEPGFVCTEGRCQCRAGSCGPYACRDTFCRSSCVNDSDCADGFGCVDRRCVHCRGTPLPCEKQASCTLPGCTTVDRCEGGPIDCSTLSKVGCEVAVGCTLSGACTGTAQCADQSLKYCTLPLDCKIGKTCTGTTTLKCNDQSVAGCGALAGCVLDDKP